MLQLLLTVVNAIDYQTCTQIAFWIKFPEEALCYEK